MLCLHLFPVYLMQDHTEATPLPRLPELYLEAGAALLMAGRPADCMALCNEVINTTLELLPEKLVLEDPEDRSEGGEGEDKVPMLLWTAAAYLLQGHCHTHLKDWKQAVTHYTRSVRWKCHNDHVSIPILPHYKIVLCAIDVSTC